MRSQWSWLLVLSLLVLGINTAAALESDTRLTTSSLVPFATEEGMVRLSRSDARVDFPHLANQFEAQFNGGFCGPTSAAVVLNALFYGSEELPRDKTRFHPGDLKYVPTQFDFTVPRFTQDNVILQGEKTRAQVFGEPISIKGEKVPDFGYQLRQLDEMLSANGAQTKMVVVDSQLSADEIRAELIANLKTPDDYILVNYKRAAVGQKGGGHISPLAAYDERSDSFLVMDVNPTAAGWVWMSAATLIDGMRTFDTVENRGYVLLKR